MVSVLIVDDEEPARELIRHFLNQRSDVQVVAEASNGFEALKIINEQKPELLILDIKMPKITGFELVDLLDNPPMIIFSTAYDEYAIAAFEMNAIDYLLKPYTKDRLFGAIDKCLEKKSAQSKILEPVRKMAYRQIENQGWNRLVVRNGSMIQIIPFLEIRYILAADDYIEIFSTEGKYLKQMTMKDVDAILPSDQFIRVHRSSIIRLDRIKKIEAYTKDSYLVILDEGEKISVSRNGYKKLRTLLNI